MHSDLRKFVPQRKRSALVVPGKKALLMELMQFLHKTGKIPQHVRKNTRISPRRQYDIALYA